MLRLSLFFPNDCLGRKVTRFLPSDVLFKWEWNQSWRQLSWSHCNVAQDTITSNNLILNILSLNILSTAPLFVATKFWNRRKVSWWMIETRGLQLWCLNCGVSVHCFLWGKLLVHSFPSSYSLGGVQNKRQFFLLNLVEPAWHVLFVRVNLRFPIFKSWFCFIPREQLSAFNRWLCWIVGSRTKSYKLTCKNILIQ